MKPANDGEKNSRYWLIASIVIIMHLVLHLLTATNYELYRDEMLYFNMGDHLYFGYLTVPPLTGFLAFVIKLIFGYSVFGIRLIPAILGSVTLFIVVKMVKELGGGIPALLVSALTFLFMPGFLLIFCCLHLTLLKYFFGQFLSICFSVW